MNEKTTHILQAAWRVFERYGVAKTTMNDIAKEAGVARQTVYNAFPGKEEVLRGVMRLSYAMTLDQIKARWAQCDDIGAKIDVFFECGPINWYETVQAKPEMLELLDGVHHVAAEELDNISEEWTALIVQTLAQSGAQVNDPDLTLDDVGKFLFSAGINAKYRADGLVDLKTRLKVIKAGALALLA